MLQAATWPINSDSTRFSAQGLFFSVLLSFSSFYWAAAVLYESETIDVRMSLRSVRRSSVLSPLPACVDSRNPRSAIAVTANGAAICRYRDFPQPKILSVSNVTLCIQSVYNAPSIRCDSTKKKLYLKNRNFFWRAILKASIVVKKPAR